MISEEDKIMMETLYWWGIPTLFRCKNDPDPKNCDIALVGVPHSTGNGTTERDQHLGPRAVRNISAMLRRSHFDYKIDPWKENKIHDLGDVPFPEANDNEKCIERISSFYDHIEKAEKPVVSIGGDHSVTGGIVQSLAKKNSKLTKGKKISFLHFDAHTDTWPDEDGRLDHGTMFSRAIKENLIDTEHSIQIGIRTHNSNTKGVTILDAPWVHENGIQKVIEKIINVVKDRPAYLTFDIDGLDPAYAPGTGTPVVGGLTSAQALGVIRGLEGINFIGADVVEVAPAYDHADITAIAAATIAHDYLVLRAKQKRSQEQ